MNDTPETDANSWSETATSAGEVVFAKFARTVERQRNEARADIAACRVALDQYRRECGALRQKNGADS